MRLCGAGMREALGQLGVDCVWDRIAITIMTITQTVICRAVESGWLRRGRKALDG
jgi:hypothetical protein